MARPERHDVDYFPFRIKDGRTLFILEGKYNCKGTGFFTNVMRFLCQQPDHYISIKDDADRMYFFSKTKCDEESGMDMLDIMSKTGKIHRAMWVSYKVIVSEDLLDSISDAYRNRKNNIITIDEIHKKTVSYAGNSQEDGVSYTGNSQENDISDVENTQKRKEKKRKDIYWLDLSLNFHKQQKENKYNHPDFKKELTKESKIVIEGATVLERFHRIDKESKENIEKILNFILTDEGNEKFRWRDQVISLRSLRQKGNNDIYKYYNAKTSIKREKQYTYEEMTKQVTKEGLDQDDFERLKNGKYVRKK